MDLANQKFITVENGNKRLKVATSVSTGLTDAGKVMCTNSEGVLDTSMLPKGIGLDVYSAITSVALTPYQMVNIYNNAGVPTVKLAQANAVGTEAIGYVKDTYAIGDTALVYIEGEFNMSGATVNTNYFLSDTVAGEITSTAPTSGGTFIQRVGRCYDIGKVRFEQDEVIYID